ncbi:hypothetical protein SDC9_105595 [bioreactor metagenome]|uniref:Uncharacterized protein n=1 Tax=bioreactor metagenome TaxID=1076179 RepID=A0A645AZY8_9ZZZZ
MGQGVAHHGKPFEYEEGTDHRTEQGDQESGRQGVSHEIILQHGNVPPDDVKNCPGHRGRFGFYTPQR